ncbi:MAG: hypothetical protein J6I49_09455 [Bacteroidales bacterium]|nr:hypothetical protein [Bacteroidales bacterium]
MKRIHLYIAASLLLLPAAAMAQEDNAYNESVLVRGSYRPVIMQSEKLNFPARITDTITPMEHVFNYNITPPSRLKSLYEPARIKAARIIGEPATKLYNNYFRLGIGNYWTPLADLYWSSTRDRLKTYGIRMNHLSSWGSITDYGRINNGVTGITLFGKYIVKEKLQLFTDLNYEHDHNLYYGFTDSTLYDAMGLIRDDISRSEYRAKYNVATWNIGIRNMQLDVNKLGYSANLRLSDLWASWHQNEFNLNFSGDIHYGFKVLRQYKGVAFLRAEWDGYSHRFRPEGEMPLGFRIPGLTPPYTLHDTVTGTRNIVKVNPYVDFIFNDLQFHSGMTLAWDAFTEGLSTTFRFFPDIVVSKKLMKEAVAVSVGFTGGLDANNWNTLRMVNPYIAPNAEQRTTRHYDLSGHVRWSISKKLEANLEAIYSWLRDDLTFALDTHYMLGNVYNPLYVDNNRFSLGGDIAFVNDEMLTLRGGGHIYRYGNVDTPDEVMPYRPKWDALLAVDLNYHDKWLFHLEGRLLGKMQGDLGTELPMRYGVNAEVEYRHTRAVSFFLKMDNLAFQRYYYWANYPSRKALFILGLTYTMPTR